MKTLVFVFIFTISACTITFAQGSEPGGGCSCDYPATAFSNGCLLGGSTCTISAPCDCPPDFPCPSCNMCGTYTGPGDTAAELQPGFTAVDMKTGTETTIGTDFYESAGTLVDSTFVPPSNSAPPILYYSKTGRDITSDLVTYLGTWWSIW